MNLYGFGGVMYTVGPYALHAVEVLGHKLATKTHH